MVFDEVRRDVNIGDHFHFSKKRIGEMGVK